MSFSQHSPALFHSIRSIVIQPYYYCDSIPALNMSEELTLKCKCGAVECKFDALPRVCFNCQCHSCVATMKAIEGKEGFDGTSAAVDGGVGVAIYKSNNMSFVKASSDDIDFVKVGDQGKAARPYCNKCGTMVFNGMVSNPIFYLILLAGGWDTFQKFYNPASKYVRIHPPNTLKYEKRAS